MAAGRRLIHTFLSPTAHTPPPQRLRRDREFFLGGGKEGALTMKDTLSLACIWECWLAANSIALLCIAHYYIRERERAYCVGRRWHCDSGFVVLFSLNYDGWFIAWIGGGREYGYGYE